jgi:predicted small metal-binding protein
MFGAPRRCDEVDNQAKERPMGRKVADCRDFPSDSNCTLTISGEEEEVVTAATQHAVAVHGHEDTEEVRTWLRQNLKDEVSV